MITALAGIAGRFGMNAKEAERFIKFMVVGVIGFVVDFGVFNLLLTPLKVLFGNGTNFHDWIVHSFALTDIQTAALAPSGAQIVSFIAAIISNFLWNRYWTYPDSRSKSMRRQFALFSLVSVVGILIRTPIIAVANNPFTQLAERVTLLAPYAERVGANLALALGVIVVMFWNFFVNRYWTYNDIE